MMFLAFAWKLLVAAFLLVIALKLIQGDIIFRAYWNVTRRETKAASASILAVFVGATWLVQGFSWTLWGAYSSRLIDLARHSDPSLHSWAYYGYALVFLNLPVQYLHSSDLRGSNTEFDSDRSKTVLMYKLIAPISPVAFVAFSVFPGFRDFLYGGLLDVLAGKLP